MMKAIGLMSGTSMDGVDVALIETDGENIAAFGGIGGRLYSAEERGLLREAMEAATALTDRRDRPGVLAQAEHMITEAHGEAVEMFLAEHGMTHEEVDVLGFHGQTVLHRPDAGLTVQLGNGRELADRLGIDVVYDFRAADMEAGGQGAPFVPAYHLALAQTTGLRLPAAIVNIGGVANVTWIGEDGSLLAFDTGPGNALIDDWVMHHTGEHYDHNGQHAAHGKADTKRLEALLGHPFFLRKPPKSLDRNEFSLRLVEGLSLDDGAATLTAFTAASLVCALAHFPQPPQLYVLTGGGAHNGALIRALRKLLPGEIVRADALGWTGDAVEAQAFAFLAVRSLRRLPLSYPATTGVRHPVTGGVIVQPRDLPPVLFDDSLT